LGWTYFEKGEYKKAEERFLALMKKFPTNQLAEDAAFKLGECEQNLGSYDNAIKYFKSYVLKYPPSNRHADAYFYIAEAYYYLEDYLTAITYYAKAASIAYDPKVSYMSNISMGWSYLKLEKYDLAQKSFEEAEKIAADKDMLTDDLYLGKASLYAQTGDNTKALEAYTQLIDKFPSSARIVEAYLGRANINYALKNYQPAIDEYRMIIDKYGNEQGREGLVEKAFYGLAWTYLKSGQIDLSIKSFEAIMTKTDNKNVKVSALTQIGDAYQDIEQLDKAIEIYDQILRDYPDNISNDYVQFRQAIALLKMDKIEAATLSLQSLQTNFPNSKYLKEAKYYLGVAYFKKKEWGTAISQINEYLQGLTGPSELASESLYIIGLSYFNLNQYDKSLEIFRKILKEHANEKNMVAVAEFNIAKCLYHQDKVKEAIEKFQNVYTNYGETETAQEALLWLGDYSLENKKYDEAAKYYEEFLTKFPGSTKLNLVHYELGQTYEAQEHLDKALSQYKLITAEDKEIYARARLAIADIFSDQTDEQSAVNSYKEIATSVPDFQRDAYVKIARVYNNNKNYNNALKAYTDALNSPQGSSTIKNAEILFLLGDTLESVNNTALAIETYMKIPYLYSQERGWVIKAYLRLGRIFEESEKWEDAKTVYTKIIDFKTDESKYAKERVDWINQNISSAKK
jgi:TolA-binding protein